MDAGLRANLRALLNDITNQQATMVADIIATTDEPVDNFYKYKYADGSYIFVPIIVAKAQVLNALALIESKS